MYDCADIISPYDTPWRVIMAAERAVDLINHKDMVLNLNAERTVGDWSWVRPGKAFRSGRLDKAFIFKSIDYCKQLGFDYVELDAGWYGPEGKVSSDARRVIESRDFTMPEVCQYAKSQGIGVWVYVNQRALYRQLDELLPLYKEWGISGIKFGFVHIGNQQWSTWLHEAVRKCADYQLMVDIHDEYRPTGLARTLPNLLTQEGIRGNEEMPDADHNVTLPFTRFLAGPADYTVCYYTPRKKTTYAHQLALPIVYYSPLQFLYWYDAPSAYQGEEELLLWDGMPTVWDESICIDGAPGLYIVQARRKGDVWYVGVLNTNGARDLTITTGDFLRRGTYTMDLYTDDPSLATRTNVRHETIELRSGHEFILHLQPSGGAAMRFTPNR